VESADFAESAGSSWYYHLKPTAYQMTFFSMKNEGYAEKLHV
jgi:hypothetical protein